MRKKYYNEDIENVRFAESKSKASQRYDPAIDYSYENKTSFFSRKLKERKEKEIIESGHAPKDENSERNMHNSYKETHNQEYDYKKIQKSTDKKKTKNIMEKIGINESDIQGTMKKIYNGLNENDFEKISSTMSYASDKLKEYGSLKSGKKCSVCGTEMPKNAKRCPRCGRKKRSIKKIVFIVVLIAILANIIPVIIGLISVKKFGERIPEYVGVDNGNYIDYSEYYEAVPVVIKDGFTEDNIFKHDSEGEILVGKDIPAGEYLIVTGDNDYGVVSVYENEDDFNDDMAFFSSFVQTDCYVSLKDGQIIDKEDLIMYKTSEVSLDMNSERARKGGMYKIGTDVGKKVKISGKKDTTASAVMDKDMNVIEYISEFKNGETDIDLSEIEGAYYIEISDGELIL